MHKTGCKVTNNFLNFNKTFKKRLNLLRKNFIEEIFLKNLQKKQPIKI